MAAVIAAGAGLVASGGCALREPGAIWRAQGAVALHNSGSGRAVGTAAAAWRGTRPLARQRLRRAVVVNAAAKRERLPIFPLSIVALPAADVPLQIYEARYRVLFSTLLAGAEGVEEGLVSTDKPWCGSRRFGMVFYDSQQGGVSSVGTVLKIKRHVNLDDGRILVENVGQERFRILEVVEQKPVLVCDVEYFEEDRDASADTEALGREVGELFRSLVSLSLKLRDGPALPKEVTDPSQLNDLDPWGLSFWVASLFAGNPFQQQTLLEMPSTRERLESVKSLLENTVKYMSAQAALASAFKGSSSSEPDVAPPPGGPD